MDIGEGRTRNVDVLKISYLGDSGIFSFSGSLYKDNWVRLVNLDTILFLLLLEELCFGDIFEYILSFWYVHFSCGYNVLSCAVF